MMKLQFHLIGRSDDICKLETEAFSGHADPRFSRFALQLKVTWSKAVYEERTCPEQIILGAMDSEFCFLISFAIYLEQRMSQENGRNCKFVFCHDTEVDSADELVIERVKNNYMNNLREVVFKNEEFKMLHNNQKGLGSHSLRKFASTWAHQNGATHQDVETRGRWKTSGHKIVAGRYIDINQPHVDGRVESLLCVGGPIAYRLIAESGATMEWLYASVVPGIVACYGVNNTICEVLGLALLWAAHEESQQNKMSATLLEIVKDAYRSIKVAGAPSNPVKRVLLNVYTIQENLCIDEVVPELPQDGVEVAQVPQRRDVVGTPGTGGAAGGVTQAQLNGVFIQIQQTRQQIESAMLGVNASFTNMQHQVEQHFRIVNRNLARIHIQPPRMANPEQRQQNMLLQDAAAQEEREPAELSPNPKTLYDLWTEYQRGIGGRKRAKDFTPTERGRCKKTYSRRKVVWVMIDHLLRSRPNTTVQSAVDAILASYGRNLPVTRIIDGLVRDRRTGGHPNLR
jgi:hypothetical protein